MPSQQSRDVAAGVGLPSPLEEIHDPAFEAAGARLLLKRDDVVDPLIPGNKLRKLKYNLEAAAEEGAARLLTFGGAYSNHVLATAAAGARRGMETIGVIRGEEHLPLNPVLARAAAFGMHLAYLDRQSYRKKTSEPVLAKLH